MKRLLRNTIKKYMYYKKPKQSNHKQNPFAVLQWNQLLFITSLNLSSMLKRSGIKTLIWSSFFLFFQSHVQENHAVCTNVPHTKQLLYYIEHVSFLDYTMSTLSWSVTNMNNLAILQAVITGLVLIDCGWKMHLLHLIFGVMDARKSSSTDNSIHWEWYTYTFHIFYILCMSSPRTTQIQYMNF